ncbi:hypothetical protein L2D25_26245 [Salmonella enterica subsp. enterica serovar Muenchen]|uniref:hypothetical protein n=1 Tax=Salmonella enterica TaxID=28901 RepID=UPI001F0FCF34|nr:hypothetical protein [Salmonella enterica]MCH5444862.1 hypothetical protein [Salmonella enterica subsp. enterica serovar Muenchen]
MHVDENLLPDPDNAGSVLGWGVVCSSPWELAGVYASQESAVKAASELGDKFKVFHGSYRPGTDDFVGMCVR